MYTKNFPCVKQKDIVKYNNNSIKMEFDID